MTGQEEASTFDYVIIGAGSAGCVLANRLSADGKTRVCLIEAGPPDRNRLIHIPAAVGALLKHPVVNWNFETAPQRHLNNRRLPLPRGKVLGGTSAINGMVYYRAHPKDYEGWAAAGNPGWSYREVLPYFIRSENNDTFRDSPYHGVDGPMAVSTIKRINPLNKEFMEAADHLQYPRCEDLNAGQAEGFAIRQGTIRNGRRETTATAFLRPILDRSNLHIVTDALVHRVVMEDRRATGVEIERDGTVSQISAEGEVILCGGAFGSPQILMLSGIGDAATLRSLGIEVAHDLPGVGKNLHDHLAIPLKIRTNNSQTYGLSLRALPRDIWNVIEYFLFKRGPLASHVFEGNALLRSEPSVDRPDLQIVFIPMHRNDSGFPIPLGHGYGASIVNLSPNSRGEIRLASKDPHVPPEIDPDFLSAPEDIEPMVRGFRIARRIFETPPFQEVGGTEVMPGPEVQSDEAIKEFIRQSAVTVFHPVGSCRMGSDDDAVVDPELRVRGVTGLRVVDASIFPRIVQGNTNAPVIMVAEKAADMILGRPAPPPLDPPGLDL